MGKYPPELLKYRLSALKKIEKNTNDFFECSMLYRKTTISNITDINFRLIDENKINSLKRKFLKVFDFNSSSVSQLNKNNEDNRGDKGNKVQKNK